MDYETWKRQAENDDMAVVFRQDPRKTREFFPRYVRGVFDNSRAVRNMTLIIDDEGFTLHEDMHRQRKTSLTITDRKFRSMPEEYEGSTEELVEYAAKRMLRKGFARFLLAEVPNAISAALDKVDDFWHVHVGYPLKMWWKGT